MVARECFCFCHRRRIYWMTNILPNATLIFPFFYVCVIFCWFVVDGRLLLLLVLLILDRCSSFIVFLYSFLFFLFVGWSGACEGNVDILVMASRKSPQHSKYACSVIFIAQFVRGCGTLYTAFQCIVLYVRLIVLVIPPQRTRTLCVCKNCGINTNGPCKDASIE